MIALIFTRSTSFVYIVVIIIDNLPQNLIQLANNSPYITWNITMTDNIHILIIESRG